MYIIKLKKREDDLDLIFCIGFKYKYLSIDLIETLNELILEDWHHEHAPAL